MTLTATDRRDVRKDDPSETAQNIVLRLLAHCQAEEWSGYDPYDALNSKVLSSLLTARTKWPRIAVTQLLRRSPINLRPLLGIPKTQNPKTLALALSAVIKLNRLFPIKNEALPGQLVSRLEATRSPGHYWCWGYSFPWQGRSILVGRAEPNLVCTTFVAEALLDLFEETGDARYLLIAESAGSYLLNELFWTDGKAVASFGYPTASARSRVHNANLLAAAFLLRLHRHTGRDSEHKVALEAATYSANCQQPNGSWPYGALPGQEWIDNFHSGYNLCALRRIANYAETNEFDQNLDRGYNFYREHFFREDGAPRYFHNRTYPIDVHCVAQSVITLSEFSEHDPSAAKLAEQVLRWAVGNLWDDRGGFFYYRRLTWGTVKISYMRWAQAWMLLALATFLQFQKSAANHGN